MTVVVRAEPTTTSMPSANGLLHLVFLLLPARAFESFPVRRLRRRRRSSRRRSSLVARRGRGVRRRPAPPDAHAAADRHAREHLVLPGSVPFGGAARPLANPAATNAAAMRTFSTRSLVITVLSLIPGVPEGAFRRLRAWSSVRSSLLQQVRERRVGESVARRLPRNSRFSRLGHPRTARRSSSPFARAGLSVKPFVTGT